MRERSCGPRTLALAPMLAGCDSYAAEETMAVRVSEAPPPDASCDAPCQPGAGCCTEVFRLLLVSLRHDDGGTEEDESDDRGPFIDRYRLDP